MTRIQFYGATSLDGYLATPDDDLDWLTQLPDVPAAPGEAVLRQMTAAVMGRATYDTIQRLAPGAPLNPANPTMTSVVFTHHPRPATPSVTFTAQPPVPLVRRLAAQTPENLWVVGGAAILTPLMAAGLVDDLYLQIAPILLGRGKRLFGDLTTPQAFELVTVHRLGPLAELVYQRTN